MPWINGLIYCVVVIAHILASQFGLTKAPPFETLPNFMLDHSTFIIFVGKKTGKQ